MSWQESDKLLVLGPRVKVLGPLGRRILTEGDETAVEY